MKVFKSAQKLTNYLDLLRSEDQRLSIGFVPTMGALHAGHLSLIDASVRDNDLTVCTIFVNPMQFGEEKDLVTYPKPIDEDMAHLISHGCDILFLPEVDEVYPAGFEPVHYELNGLDLRIEGASRPGHFQGVCNVLARFFEIIAPERAYFGQKDYQQTVVVRKLLELLGSDITLCIEPIAREPHGLAMSSRNVRLSADGFMKARFIRDALLDIKNNFRNLGLDRARVNAAAMLDAPENAELDYLEIVDADTLDPLGPDSQRAVVLTVVQYEGVRLLDNLLLDL